MGSTSGGLHGDSMFDHGLGIVLHCSNLVEGPCFGLVDGTKAKSVWLDVNFDQIRFQVTIEQWFIPHHQISKGQDGIPKIASRGRTRSSCLCVALKKNRFFGELLLDGNKC